MTIPAAVAAGLLLLISLPALVPGCGPAAPEVDKAAAYSPESLAQELAFRYNALNPESKKSTRKATRKSRFDKSIADVARDEQIETKAGGEATKKRTGPPNIDDLLEDIGSKMDKIKGSSRAETSLKMIEALSKDNSLNEADKQLLSEKLKELGQSS